VTGADDRDGRQEDDDDDRRQALAELIADYEAAYGPLSADDITAALRLARLEALRGRPAP
jgi:hypothetical protein